MGQVALTLTAHHSHPGSFSRILVPGPPRLVLSIGQDRALLVVKAAWVILMYGQGKDTLV